MPLIEGKSDKARSENIATEIKAGKPAAQAAAIGYAEQRRAEHTADLKRSLDACNAQVKEVAKDYRRK